MTSKTVCKHCYVLKYAFNPNFKVLVIFPEEMGRCQDCGRPGYCEIEIPKVTWTRPSWEIVFTTLREAGAHPLGRLNRKTGDIQIYYDEIAKLTARLTLETHVSYSRLFMWLINRTVIHEYCHLYGDFTDREAENAENMLIPFEESITWKTPAWTVWDFGETLQEYLESKEDNWVPKIGIYHPSMLALPCIRSAWYRYKCPKPAPRRKLPLFALGTLVHDFAEHVLNDSPSVICVAQEQTLHDHVNDVVWHGRPDAVLFDQEEGQKKVVEFKSTTSYGFRRIMQGPLEHHVLQLIIYLHMTDLKNGYIVYIDRGTGKTQTFPVEYDPTKYSVVADRVKRLHKHLVEGTVPPKPVDCWQCRGYCNYVEECQNELS